MTEVHVIYTGIVGFVPTRSGLTVIVQDAKNAPHHPHVPHVVIEAGAYVGHKDLNEVRPAKNGLRAFLLEQHDVSVVNKIQEGPLREKPNFREFVLLVGGGCPSSSAACGAILESLLGGAVPPSVAARVPLEEGILETTFVDPKAQWHFTGFPGAPKFLAEEVCHNFHVDEAILTLTFAKSVGRSGELRVQVPRGARTIEVRIGNLPKDLVFSPPQDWVCDDDEHVTLYYDLSSVPPPRRHGLRCSKPPRPLPDPPQLYHTHRLTPPPPREARRAQAQAACPRMVHGPNCPPALWARAS